MYNGDTVLAAQDLRDFEGGSFVPQGMLGVVVDNSVRGHVMVQFANGQRYSCLIGGPAIRSHEILTVGRYTLVPLNSRLVRIDYPSGYSQTALRWPDGQVAYDMPYTVPAYVRKVVDSLIGG